MLSRRQILEESDSETYEELMLKARMDFKYFCENILKYNNDGKQIIIKPFHEEWVNMFINNKLSCIAACRGSGKTSVLSVYFPLWRMLFHKYEKFLVISNNLQNSKYLLSQVRNYIEGNEILGVLKPTTQNLSWTKTLLNTSTGCSMRCKPFSNSVRTLHVNWAILDEVSLYQDVHLYNSAVSPTIKRLGGHLIGIGTPLTLVDLLQKFKENPKFVYKEYPAIGKNGEPLFPEGLPLSMLEEAKEEMGVADFNREYLLKIVADETSPIPLTNIVKCFDPEKSFVDHIDNQNKERKIFIGADFAISPVGDWTVFTVVEKKQDTFEVLKIERMRGVYWKEQIGKLYDLNQKFQPIKILADASNFGVTFVSEMQAKGMPVTGFVFAPKNKKEIYSNMINLINSGAVTIPRNQEDANTVSITDQLIKELSHIIIDKKSSFNNYVSVAKHDDCVDSLALALHAGTTYSSGVRYIASHKRMKLPASKYN